MKRIARIFLSAALILSMLCSMVCVGFATTDTSQLSWTIYDNSTPKIGSGGTLTKTAGAAVSVVTDKIYEGADGDGDGKAYCLNSGAFAQYVSAKVNLKKNTYYTLTAYYYCAALDNYAYGPDGVFSHLAVTRDGGAITTPADNLGFIDRAACYYTDEFGVRIDSDDRINNDSVKANAWNKITLTLYSGSTDNAYIVFRPTVGGQSVYIDNISLTEGETTNLSNSVLGNWAIYDNTTTKLGTGGKATQTATAAVSTATDNFYAAEDDVTSTQFNTGCYAQWPTANLTLKPNTYYELSLYYFCKTLDGYQWGDDGVFSDVVVAKNGGGKSTEADHLYYIGRNSCYFIDKTGVKATGDARINSGVAANSWNKLTMRFYSGDVTDAVLALRPTVNNNPVYIDNVKLTDVAELGVLSNWAIYDNTTTKLGTGGKATQTATAAVSTATDNFYAAEDDVTSTQFSTGCYAQWPTANLTLKPNTYYELSLYYFCKTLDGYQWGDDGVFSDVVVAKNGGGKSTEADHLYYIGRNSCYFIDRTGAKATGDARINSGVVANSWNKLTMRFYSGDVTDAALALRPTVNNNPVYIDNVKLAEVTELDVLDNWTMYDMSTQKVGSNGTPRNPANYSITLDKTMLYSGACADTDGLSVAVSGGFAQLVTAELKVEKNKKYKLTIHYKSNQFNASGLGILSHAFVIKPNGASPLKGSDTDVLSMIDESTAYCKADGVTNSTISDLTTRTNISITDWNTMELYFNSSDFEELLVSFRPTNQAVVYFDGFSLMEVASLPIDDQQLNDWEIFDNSTGKIGTGGTPTFTSTASVTISKDKVYSGVGADDDSSSFKLNAGCYAQYVTKKMEFKANTYYKLTAFYNPTKINANSVFSHVNMVKDGGIRSDSTTDNMGSMGRNYSYYTNKNNCIVPLDGTTSGNIKANEWNELTLYFYSGNNTDGRFVMRPAVDDKTEVYIDAISLTEVAPLAGADKVPSGWSVYTMESEKLGTGGSRHATALVDVATDLTYTGKDGDGDNKSYLMDKNCYAQYATFPLEMNANTYYNLTFYYYSTSLGAEESILGEVKLLKDGEKNLPEGIQNLGYLSRDSAYYTNRHALSIARYDAVPLKKVKANTWNKIVVPFYSGENQTLLLSVRPVAYTETDTSVGVPVYIDGIKLAETTSEGFAYADTKPFEGWNGPQDVAEINFDDFYVPMNLSQRMQLVEGPAKKNGEVSIATHILQGSYQSATVPNIDAVGSDTDPVFTIPVLPSTKYSIKYSLYITEHQPSLDFFGFYYDFFYTDGTEDTTTIIRNAGMPERGEWVTFESFFTTKPDQTVCTLAWNAGHTNIDMYIDDIVLRKLKPGIAYSAEDSSYSEDFYNILIDNGVISDIKAAKSGVYKLPVKSDAFYTLGLNAGSSKPSSSRIFLSFNGVDPMPVGADAPSSAITANGKMKRYGMSFITDYSGYVYLVIENDDGALKITDPTLFFAYKLTKDENKGYETDPNKDFEGYTGTLKNLWLPGDSEDYFLLGMEDEFDYNEDYYEDYEDSPATGSKSIMPIVAIFITALMASALSIPFKKGGKQI